MQNFFVFDGGDTIAKFKSKLCLRWSRWFREKEFSVTNFPFLGPPDSTSHLYIYYDVSRPLLSNSQHFHTIEGNQGADMTMLANKLNYDREVIRVWFCNKRQALKNTIKKFKGNGGLDESGNADSPGEDMSPNQSLNTSSQQIHQIQTPQTQQQLQQSPIQSNVQQVQNTVNVVSSISQSLANVVANSSSPKTVITLAANVTTAATANNTAANQLNTPTQATQNSAPSTSPTTLKIGS